MERGNSCNQAASFMVFKQGLAGIAYKLETPTPTKHKAGIQPHLFLFLSFMRKERSVSCGLKPILAGFIVADTKSRNGKDRHSLIAKIPSLAKRQCPLMKLFHIYILYMCINAFYIHDILPISHTCICPP